MAYIPPNPNGQATSANSAPVVLASDQSVLTAKVSDGTNNAGVFVPGTPNSTANAVVVAGTSESHAFNVSAVQTGTTYDVGNCAWVSVQILTQYTGTTPTITFQTSNDGTNWVACTLENTTSTTGAGVTGTSTAGNSYQGPLPGRYFRLNFTGAYTSGTATGTVSFFTTSRVLHTLGAAVQGTISPADAASLSGGLPVAAAGEVFNGTTWDRQRSATTAAATTGTGLLGAGALGIYNSSAPTITNGNYERLQLDVNGNLKDSLATLIAGEDLPNNVLRVEQHGTYIHIAAGQATTTVKSGAGFLYSITFNSAAAATNVTTLYDNTAGSGTVIAIPATTSVTTPVTVQYNITFTTGLTIVTSTANGSDITVSYR